MRARKPARGGRTCCPTTSATPPSRRTPGPTSSSGGALTQQGADYLTGLRRSPHRTV